MEPKKLLDAFEGISDKYKQEADIFYNAGSRARKKNVIVGVFKWSAGLAAGLALVAGLLFLGRLQTPPVSSAATGSEAASAPVEEAPGLVFGDEAGPGQADIAMPEGGWTEDLTEAQIASIWGQEELRWDGMEIPLRLVGRVTYDGNGEPWAVWIQGDADGPNASWRLLEVELASDGLPPSCFGWTPKPTCEFWGTEVAAQEYYSEDSLQGGAAVEFVRDTPETVGLRAKVRTMDAFLDEEEARKLLNALTAQSLRPGNIFTLSGLQAKSQDPDEGVIIDEEGRLHFADPDRQTAYEALLAHLDELGTPETPFYYDIETNEPVPYEKEVARNVEIIVPNIIWQGEVDGEERMLANFWWIRYLIYAEPGWWDPLDPIIGPVGIRFTPEGTELWFPENGYAVREQSLKEFVGMDAPTMDALAQFKEVYDRLTTSGYHDLYDTVLSLFSDYADTHGLYWTSFSACIPGDWDGVSPIEPPEPISTPLPQPTPDPIYEEGEDAEIESIPEGMADAAVEIAADLVNEWLEGMDGEHTGEIQECFFQNLRVTHVGEDGESFLMSLRLVFKPTNATETYGWWWAGNTRDGIGEEEGYLIASRVVQVNRIDGAWQFGGWGTGMISTEGFVAVDWPLGDQLTESKVLDLAEKAEQETLTQEDFAPYAAFDRRPDFNALAYSMPRSLEVTYAPGQTLVTAILHNHLGDAIPLSEGKLAVENFLYGAAESKPEE